MSDTKKVRINLTEKWSHNYVVEVPREMTPAEVESYVCDGLLYGRLDMDAVRDCGDCERAVQFIEVVKTENEELIDNIKRVVEQLEMAIGREVSCVLKEVSELIAKAEKNKKEE